MTNTPRAVLRRDTPFVSSVSWTGPYRLDPGVLHAGEDVAVDRASIAALDGLPFAAEAVRAVGGNMLAPAWTPDFHRSGSVPVGSVLPVSGAVMPWAVGGDIGCAMALAVLDVTREEFDAARPRLRPLLRHAFYEGGRDLPTDARAREAILREGTYGLRAALGLGGLLDNVTEEDLLAHALSSDMPVMPTRGVGPFGDFVRGAGGVSRDSQTGSLSGGNHFLEFGYVASRECGATCHANGLVAGQLTILAHNGSVGFGTAVGLRHGDAARRDLPRSLSSECRSMPAIPLNGAGEDYLSDMGLAANFAATNRTVLLLMARRCLSEALERPVALRPLLDAPHNMAWRDGDLVLHRKGAAPAPRGGLVTVPGSSGTATLLFEGLGLSSSWASAPHGAGRSVTRSLARRDEEAPRREGEVLSPVDLGMLRPDIAAGLRAAMREEAPSRYKDVEAIGRTVEGAGMGRRIGSLLPLMTLKR